MARKKKHDGDGHPDERWLLPYSDMITLLLGLFIVLFAMSSIDSKKFDNLSRSLSQTFKGQVITQPGNVLTGSSGVLDPQAANETPSAQVRMREDEASDARDESQRVQQQQFERERQALEQYVTQGGLQGKVDVVASERGITIRLAGDALFKSGSAQLNDTMLASLNFVARDITRNRRHIAIEGHTDGVPIHNAQFSNNWTLSGARAYTVLDYLISRRVSPSLITSYQGFGSNKPVQRPKYPAEPIARNRRVDIVILAPGADAGPNVARIPAGRGAGVALPRIDVRPHTSSSPAGIAPAPVSIVDPIKAVS